LTTRVDKIYVLGQWREKRRGVKRRLAWKEAKREHSTTNVVMVSKEIKAKG
jgi:hypothetical protein